MTNSADNPTLATAQPLLPHWRQGVWAAPHCRTALEAAGLASLEEVMQTQSGELLRALPDRENWRLELHAAHAGPRGAYLKKHHYRSWANWLRARLGLPLASAGRVEAENVARLERDGIPALRVLAFGERLATGGRIESFVLTEELVGYVQLDHFLRARFPEHDRSASQNPALGRLIARVAEVARAFHARGYNHRDLYCCHFFIKETAEGDFSVRLIDLQRVQRRSWLRRRWIVKDLAQLAYSAPRERIACRHKVLFLRGYFNVRRLLPAHKWLVRSVVGKQRRMERRLGLHP